MKTILKSTLNLLAALLLASCLTHCNMFRSVGDTASRVVTGRNMAHWSGDRSQAQPLQFGGVRNEYHAALERRKQDAILEILNQKGSAQ